MRWNIVTRSIRRRRNGRRSRASMVSSSNMVVVSMDWLLSRVIIITITATARDLEAEDSMARRIR
jgi:hypothetical protein